MSSLARSSNRLPYHVRYSPHTPHECVALGKTKRQQDAVSEYVELMKTEAGVDKVPVVTVEEDPAKCLSAGW